MQKNDKKRILKYIENLKSAQTTEEVRNYEQKIIEVVREDTPRTSKQQVRYKKSARK